MSTFTYFGEEFTYSPEFPRFAYAEFMEALADGEDAESDRSTGVALRLAVALVAEEDRARFRAVSRKNNAAVTDWLTVTQQWTAEETERPTGPPTASSGGQPGTPERFESQPEASVTPLPVWPEIQLALARSAG